MEKQIWKDYYLDSERLFSMNDDQERRLVLKVAALMDFLPVVTQCVETAAVFFGLGRNESLKLRLAAEEIFSYLSLSVCRGELLEVQCTGGISYARIEFHFSVSALNMSALNMTTAVSGDSDEDMAQMGLVIASRIVDRLYITTGLQNRVVLAMEEDKVYPPLPDIPVKALDIRGGLTVATPDTEGIKRFILQTGLCAHDPLRPAFFKYPGKVADMVAAGNCHALTAQDAAGNIAGGMLYRLLTEKIIEIFCPCIFYPSREEEIAALLMETCISKTARTKALGLVNLTGLPSSLRGQFETLGALTYFQEGGVPIVRQAFCRLLHEDSGCLVWTDPVMKDYLEGEYSRLFLARDIREIRNLGETRTGPSIFATELHRERSEAFLRPLWPGVDQAINLNRHIEFCRKESLCNIFFVLDLGISWHASLMPILMSCHFKAEVIIPFAGQADLVIFQYHEPES